MHEKSVELLNKAVGDELSAVHQYMYFHFHCDDQGFDLLAGLFKQTAIEEMLHIERLAERILFLKGEVELVASAKVKQLHEVKEMLTLAKDMEQQSALDYNRWANECGANADSVSKKLFEDLVADEDATSISTTPSWRTWTSSAIGIWRSSPSSGARIGQRGDPRSNQAAPAGFKLHLTV